MREVLNGARGLLSSTREAAAAVRDTPVSGLLASAGHAVGDTFAGMSPDMMQNLALDVMPGIGDVKAVREGVANLRQGNTGQGLFDIATAIPAMIPAVRGLRGAADIGKGLLKANRAGRAARTGATLLAEGANSGGVARTGAGSADGALTAPLPDGRTLEMKFDDDKSLFRLSVDGRNVGGGTIDAQGAPHILVTAANQRQGVGTATAGLLNQTGLVRSLPTQTTEGGAKIAAMLRVADPAPPRFRNQDIQDYDEAIAKSHAENDGATFDPRTGADQAGSDTWALATPTQKFADEPFTAEQVRDFRLEYADLLEANPNLRVGSWFDRNNKIHGRHELNLTETFPTREAAEGAARQRVADGGKAEKAIMHLDPDYKFPEYDIEYPDAGTQLNAEGGNAGGLLRMGHGFDRARELGGFGGQRRPVPTEPHPAQRASLDAPNGARADDLGYDTPAWHGTNANFDRFDQVDGVPGHHFALGSPDAANHVANGYAGLMGNNPPASIIDEMVEQGASGASVMPLRVKMKNPLGVTDSGLSTLDDFTSAFSQADPRFGTQAQLRREVDDLIQQRYGSTYDQLVDEQPTAARDALDAVLRKRGYDGIQYSNNYEAAGSQSGAVFNPNQIRSQFAQFDPANIDSDYLLAAKGGSGGGLLRMADYEGPFFPRDVPKLEGQVPTPEALQIPEPRTERTRVSPLIQEIAERPGAVRSLLDSDVQRRMEQAPDHDESWYETGPIKADLDKRGAPLSFDDMQIFGGVASQQNSVPMENAIMSVMNFARVNGLPFDDAMREYTRITGDPGNLSSSAEQFPRAFRLAQSGLLLPSDLHGANWKTPSYSGARRGFGNIEEPHGRSLGTADSHERQQIMNGVYADPVLARIADMPYHRTREGGLLTPRQSADANKGQIPISNAKEYKTLIESLYLPGARQFGLPTNSAYQAPRWEGGQNITGIRSPVGLSYTQILEQQLRDSLRFRKVDPTQGALSTYWDDIAQGRDMLMMPPSWRKWK
jgi:hypothetical protein